MREFKLATLLLPSLLLIGSISCLIPGVAYAEEEQPTEPPHFRSSGTGPDVKVEASKAAKEAKKYRGTDNSTPEDDKSRLTAEGAATPEAQRYWNWARCASVSIGTTPNDGHVSDEDCSLPIDPTTGTVTRVPTQLPTTRDLLLAAATTIHADGAGLHKRPEGVSYTNKYIPTLVAATHPTQTHTVTLLGHDITVTLTATSYTWSWGDGTPDLTTTSPGMPWQEGMDPNTDPALGMHIRAVLGVWVEVFPGRTIPQCYTHHHTHHHLGGHGHQPLHGRHPDH